MECVGGGTSGPDGLVCRHAGGVLVCRGRAVWPSSPAASAVVQGQRDANVCGHVGDVPLAVMARVAARREWFGSRWGGKAGLVAGVCSDQQLSGTCSARKQEEN